MCFIATICSNKLFCVLSFNLGSVYVDFDQSSYSINENAGFVKLTLVLSRPMSCNCYVALTVRATDDTAKSK